MLNFIPLSSRSLNEFSILRASQRIYNETLYKGLLSCVVKRPGLIEESIIILFYELYIFPFISLSLNRVYIYLYTLTFKQNKPEEEK
jgi:hypothetical protein